MEEIAKGRVYTGQQAKAIGLVDELGGCRPRSSAPRKLRGSTASTPVEIEEIPGEPTPAELLRSFFAGSDDEDDDVISRLRFAAALRTWARLRALIAPLVATPADQTYACR